MDKIQKSNNRQINSQRLILCEGEDEKRLLSMLRRARALDESDVEIVSAAGDKNFENKWRDVRAQSGGSDIRYVALVFDSEDDPQGAQQWASDFVATHKNANLQFAVFQLPANDQQVALDTLIRQAIAPTSVGYACATQWEACVQADETTQFGTTARKDKAWLQVWLTHRTTSTASSVGYAITHDKSPNQTLRHELDTALEPLRKILDSVLRHTHV